MALAKSKKTWVCFIHCFTYTLAFAFVTQSWRALAVIFATHFLIDRFGLARYIIWAKNWQQPGGYYPWSWCSLSGYFDQEMALNHIEAAQNKDLARWARSLFSTVVSDSDVNRPIWIRIWLLIITDNTLHLLSNFFAIRYLG
jgi:hypothetical protein